MQKKSELRTLDIQISSIISLKDKRSLIISYENSKIKSFDYEKKSFSSDFTGHTDGIMCLAASPDCKFLFSGSRDETIRVWSTKSKKQLAVLEGHKDFISALAVTQDSQYLISGSFDSSIKIWELSSMSLFLNLVGHKTCIKSLTVTEDNKLLLSISDDFHTILWKIPEFSFKSTFNLCSDIELLREHPELHAVLLAKNMQSPKEL
jgi:WD40 repeat protein